MKSRREQHQFHANSSASSFFVCEWTHGMMGSLIPCSNEIIELVIKSNRDKCSTSTQMLKDKTSHEVSKTCGLFINLLMGI